MKKADIILIVILLALIGTIIYAVVRIDMEAAMCIADPIGYYEELYNVSVYGSGAFESFKNLTVDWQNVDI